MVSTALAVTRSEKAIAKIEAKTEKDRQILELIRGAGSGTKDVLVAALSNPFISLILANVTVEYLQTITIHDHFEQQLVSVPDPGGSGMGHHEWRTVDIRRPLLSQALATTIETIINTEGVLNAFSSNAGGLASIIKAAIK